MDKLNLHKSIATVLAAVLLMQTAAFAAPVAESAGATLPMMASAQAPFILLPASVAVVDDASRAATRTARDDKVIYLIQDAHTNESAQFNSAKVIEAVLDQRPVKTVFLEGGAGDDSLAFLKQGTDLAARVEAATRFVRRGLLQAAEFVNLTTDRDLTLWGVEDPSLYDRALAAYRTAAAGRDAALRHLDRIDVTLRFLKEKSFSPALLELDNARVAFARGDLSAVEYLAVLKKLNAAAGGAVKVEPILKKVSRMLKQELRQQEKEKKSGGESANLSAKNNLPEFTAAQSVQTLDAMHRFESSLYLALARPRARGLIRAGFAAESIRDLFMMQMTPGQNLELTAPGGSEWTLDSLSGFLNRRLLDLGQGAEHTIFMRPDLEPAFTAAQAFYDLTLARDEAFLRNLTRRMDATGQKEAVLIAGGYHAPNLKNLLRARGISFVSVIPQSAHPTDRARYERLLLAQVSAAADSAVVRPTSSSNTNSVRPAGWVMNLRPAAEGGARLAELTAALGLTPSAAVSAPQTPMVSEIPVPMPAAARMAAPNNKVTSKIFGDGQRRQEIAVIDPLSPSRTRFIVPVKFGDPDLFGGKFYFHYGIIDSAHEGNEWTTVEADVRAIGPEPGHYVVSAELDAFLQGKYNYAGTFVYLPDDLVKDPELVLEAKIKDPRAVWQTTTPGRNASVIMEVTKRQVRNQASAALSSLRAWVLAPDSRGTRELISVRSVSGLSRIALRLIQWLDDPTLNLRARARIAVILRDLFDEKDNYLRLSGEWFKRAANLMRSNLEQDSPTRIFFKENHLPNISQYFKNRSYEFERSLLEDQLLPIFKSKLAVDPGSLHDLPPESREDGFMRVTIAHGDAADAPYRDGLEREQWVINQPISLTEYPWGADPDSPEAKKAFPDMRVIVRRAPSASGATEIPVSSKVFDIHTPPPYVSFRGGDTTYSPNLQVTSESNIEHRYVVGALKLVSELTGLSVEEIVRKGHRLEFSIESYAPPGTGLGGSVTFGVKLLQAILKSLNLRDRISDKEYEDLAVLLEARQGGLGGKQDANAEPGLKIFRLKASSGSADFSNVSADILDPDGRVANEFADLIERHGVLFLTKPHRADNSLSQLYLGINRRDPDFMREINRALDDSAALKDYLVKAAQTGASLNIDRIAEAINRQTESFERVVPGYLTPEAAQILEHFRSQGLILGGGVREDEFGGQAMGAGFGGFLLLILRDPNDRKKVEEELNIIGGELTKTYQKEGIHSLKASVYHFRAVRARHGSGSVARRSGARMSDARRAERLRSWTLRSGPAGYFAELARKSFATARPFTMELGGGRLESFAVRSIEGGARVYLAGLTPSMSRSFLRPLATYPVGRVAADRLVGTAAGAVSSDAADWLEPSRTAAAGVDQAFLPSKKADAESVVPRVFHLDLDLFAAAAQTNRGIEPLNALAELLAAEMRQLTAGRSAPIAVQITGDPRLVGIFKAAEVRARSADRAQSARWIWDSVEKLPVAFNNAHHLDLLTRPEDRKDGHRALGLKKLEIRDGTLSLPALRAILRVADRAALIDLDNPTPEDREGMVRAFEAMGIHGASWQNIRALLTGQADQNLFDRLTFPLSGFVPLDNFVRAVQMAARMSARSV